MTHQFSSDKVVTSAFDGYKPTKPNDGITGAIHEAYDQDEFAASKKAYLEKITKLKDEGLLKTDKNSSSYLDFDSCFKKKIDDAWVVGHY